MRKVPDFRQLSAKELDIIIDQMVLKEYRDGDVLWRTGIGLDLLGIIQMGEIVVERQINGTLVRSVKLYAGDIVHPSDFRGNGRSSILARAVTDVRFYTLRMDQINLPHKRHAGSNTRPLSHLLRLRHISLRIAWIVVIALITITVSWRDMSRVLSGLLYFESERTNQTVLNHQKSVALLNYAESVDPSAVFAHNQEGYLWYQSNNLQSAEAAFTRAIGIEQTNGPSLNNLAVTYFALGQVQQAATSQKEAAQYDPNNATVHYNLGLILMKQNYNMEAIYEFKEASNINPDWVLPYLQLGFNYVQMQDYANAEKAANTAITLDPDQESAYVIHAVALYNQDRDLEALKSIDGALQLDPADNVAKFYKAIVLNDLEEFDSALSILEQLLKSTNDPGQISRISAEIEATHRFLQSRQVNSQ
jgi:tetratricopeptide (TPR) repeat protein